MPLLGQNHEPVHISDMFAAAQRIHKVFPPQRWSAWSR